MDIYRKLGIQPVINAATTYTRLGGSIMAPEVATAMAESAGVFVDMFELQKAAGRRLAELTSNEAAYISNGAVAALALATAGAITGNDIALMARLPNKLDGLKNQVIVHRTQRNWYDIAIRMVGAELVEIGHILETCEWELDDAINERTAAVVYFAGSHLNRNTLPLEFVIERAHAQGIPVIVDAAAQVPPMSNLWHFTRELGADVAIFSGGKGLRGPQNSGLAVGTETMIEAMQLNGPPVQRIGRGMKVSKEAIIGLVAAVERYLETNHEAEALKWDLTVESWLESWLHLASRWLTVQRSPTGEAGEKIPRVLMRISPEAPFTRDDLVAGLRAETPPIEVVVEGDSTLAFSPHLLQPGEAEIVEQRVARLVAGFLLAQPRGAIAGD